jgi:hypothetical protein
VWPHPSKEKKLNEEKSKHASSALQNWFLAQHFHTRCKTEAGVENMQVT